jgi:energy-coupling factor transport system ATP-binding protein
MEVLDIKHLNFSYGKHKVFNDFNLKIKLNSWTTILGKNGCGKSTLAKILGGLLEFDGKILLGKKAISKSDISVVIDNNDEYMPEETVMDEITNTLNTLNLTKEEMKNTILNVTNKLEIIDILDYSFGSLNWEKSKLVSLAIALIKKPEILVLDNFFEALDYKMQRNVLDILNGMNLTIINITNNVEEVFWGKNVIIVGSDVVSGTIKKVFTDEKLIAQNNLECPFVALLSNKLKFYDLVDETYFDELKLVNDLWK